MPIHECTLPHGGKGYKWGQHGDCYADRKKAEEQAAAAHANGYVGDRALAFDRASVRTIDRDGRLHVEVSNISKATVNPYYGREIPRYAELGLNADSIYQLLRDPAELALAAPTFNNLPLLTTHIPVNADNPQKDAVIGSTGTDAEFVAPYLKNSLVVWDAGEIAGIQSRQKYEISCGYYYDADMTPGVYEGVPYDGVMRNIIGNHVALVEVGRAGPDVVVSDSNPFKQTEIQPMSKKALRTTLAARKAVKAYLRPLLAADAALDFGALVGTVTSDTIAEDAQRIASNIEKMMTGDNKLALDGKYDADELQILVMDALEVEKPSATDDDDDKDKDKDKASDEDDDDEDKDKASDEDDDDDEDKDKAMDAAIKAAAANAEAKAIKRMQDIRAAEKMVEPIIGEVAAMDSAEAVYKLALDHLKIDVSGVHPSAYPALIRAHTEAKPKTSMAEDRAVASGFWKENFPNAVLPKRI